MCKLTDRIGGLIPKWMTDPIHCQSLRLVKTPFCSINALGHVRQFIDAIGLSFEKGIDKTHGGNAIQSNGGNHEKSELPMPSDETILAGRGNIVASIAEGDTRGDNTPAQTTDRRSLAKITGKKKIGRRKP